MPIHRGPRLDDLISRAVGVIPIQPNIYKTWPNLAAAINVTSADPSAWVEFISAANAPTQPFTVTHVYEDGAIGSASCVEFGVGALGAEVAVGMCSIMAYNSNDGLGVVNPLPYIPGGSRVTVRNRSASASGSPAYKIVTALLPPPVSPSSSSLRLASRIARWYPGLYGIHGGTAFVAAAANWVYGSYVETAAANVESSPGIIVSVQLNNLNGAVGQVAYATGGAGSEVVWGEFPFGTLAGRVVNYPLPIPIYVPGSTRYAAKAANASGSPVNVYSFSPIFSKGAEFP